MSNDIDAHLLSTLAVPVSEMSYTGDQSFNGSPSFTGITANIGSDNNVMYLSNTSNTYINTNFTDSDALLCILDARGDKVVEFLDDEIIFYKKVSIKDSNGENSNLSFDKKDEISECEKIIADLKKIIEG